MYMRPPRGFLPVAFLVTLCPLAAVAVELGPVGEPVVVAAGLDQAAASDAALGAGGDFVVVWTGPDLDDPVQRDVYARHFDPTGTPTAAAFSPAQTLSGSQESPAALALPDGGWALAWYQDFRILFPGASAAQGLDVSARVLDPSGTPAGEERVLNQAGTSGARPELAPLPGGFVAAWHAFTPSRVEMRRFDADGEPQGDQARADSRDAFVSSNGVATAADGRAVVVWDTQFGPGDNLGDVWGRLFDAGGAPVGPEFRLNSTTSGWQRGAQVAAAADGAFVAVWLSSELAGEVEVRARLFARDGAPRGSDFVVNAPGARDRWTPRVAREASGAFVVAWLASSWPGANNVAVVARHFDRQGSPLGPEVQVSDSAGYKVLGGLAGDGRGAYLVSWSAAAPPGETGQAVFARRLLPRCSSDPECLAGRFHVEVEWRTPDGRSGTGTAIPITSDTGAFWFFSPENPELILKVLDGRAVNGHFWVFLGGLTDVAFDLRVTDTLTGARWSHANPQGTLAAHADTSAFADASSAATAPDQAPAAVALPAHPPTACAPQAEVLCLGETFVAAVVLDDPRAGTARPQAVQLTSDSGYFWFFDPANVEVLVKIVDGRAVNGRVWVFYTALTDLGLELLVANDNQHQGRAYLKPAGRLESRADTDAF